MELFARGAISASKRWAAETMTDCRADLVVKEQAALKQMLVCYESILAGESSAFLWRRSDLFIDTLRHMVTADPLTFEKLTA